MRQRINIDNDWKFFPGDLAPHTPADHWGGAKAHAYGFGATAIECKDEKWRSVDLPHDFVMEGDYTRKSAENSDMQKIPEMESIDSRHFAGGSLAGGIGWYRKKFSLSEADTQKRVYLYFDGIYRNSTIYLNEYYVGTHTSGYTSFYYDITDFIYYDKPNTLAVRVDATEREGWWYEGGGIYRHVWLEIRESVSVSPWGVFVSAQTDLEKGCADISIKTEITNQTLTPCTVTLETLIYNPSHETVAALRSEQQIDAWDCALCPQTHLLDSVQLWDLDTPALYQLQTNLYLDNVLTDSCSTDFGIRDIRFDADKGLFLNGKHIRVKGVCCHHDHAGVGIAVPDSVQEYRIRQLKSMGTNGYRCAHHPPTKELLDICDRLGMLVLDETRRMSSAPDDLDALRLMVKRDRNHPSIFLWGIGNEEIFSQDKPEAARTTRTMKTEIQKLDGTRPITSAVVCWNGTERFDTAKAYIPVTQNLDVMGFNYCKTAWDNYHERMPKQPVIITEASTNSGTRGCYNTCEDSGAYFILDPDNENKVVNKRKAVRENVGESEWKYFAEREYLAGIFLWTGIDYRGEPTPLSYPAVYSQFGILDYCGFPKDNFFYYQSWWQEKPVLHIFPHWNFPDMEGKELTVYCYSNLDEIELFVNGKSYGRKSMECNWYLSWENVIYEPGEVSAKGYKDGMLVLVEAVKTTDAPYKLQLTPYKPEISIGDTAIINVSVTDRNGLVVPTADNEIYFEIEGGTFLGTGNGNPGSHESDKLPVRRAFHGLCQLLVKADANSVIRVAAKSNGLKMGECNVEILQDFL